MPRIEISKEVYGQFARFSALADALEFAAIKGAVIKRAEVADWLSDADIGIVNELYKPEEEEPEEEQDINAQAAEIIFQVFEERKLVLGDKYPFEFGQSQLSYTGGDEKVYLQLLLLTLAHAHGIETSHKPTAVFENIVRDMFRSRGWLAECSGANRSAFAPMLQRMSSALDLDCDPTAVTRSRSANDENIDVVAHFSFRDRRVSKLIAIVQATLAKSSDWEKKSREPSSGIWTRYLKDVIPPIRLFAVPHHMEARTFRRIAEYSEGIVVDRLRLVLSLDALPAETTAIHDEVIMCETDYK